MESLQHQGGMCQRGDCVRSTKLQQSASGPRSVTVWSPMVQRMAPEAHNRLQVNIRVDEKKAVASLGQANLLLPAWVKSALPAIDRLKLYHSMLQADAALIARRRQFSERKVTTSATSTTF